jgi:hypothetical protein
MYGNLDPPHWRVGGGCADGRTGWAGGARSQQAAQLPLLAPTPLLTSLATPLLFCHSPVGGMHNWAGVCGWSHLNHHLPLLSIFFAPITSIFLPGYACRAAHPGVQPHPLFPPVLVAVACGDTSAISMNIYLLLLIGSIHCCCWAAMSTLRCVWLSSRWIIPKVECDFAPVWYV